LTGIYIWHTKCCVVLYLHKIILQMAYNKDNYLNNVLKSHDMKHIEWLQQSSLGIRRNFKESLEKHYRGHLYSIVNSGSVAKKTAINLSWDFDLVAPFRKTAFNSPERVFDEVYNFCMIYKRNNRDLVTVRKQKVSIGLTFRTRNGVVSFDIVPAEEIRSGDYPKTKFLDLYDNSGHHRIQTNIERQIERVKGTNDARDCIKLLKIWKTQKNQGHIKSFLMESLVIQAFNANKNSIPRGQWNKLRMVMEFIKNNIETIRLKDPGNSGNIVSDTLIAVEKRRFRKDMNTILNNSEYLKLYFKENHKYANNASSNPNLRTNSFG
jgi:hypothetical protein